MITLNQPSSSPESMGSSSSPEIFSSPSLPSKEKNNNYLFTYIKVNQCKDYRFGNQIDGISRHVSDGEHA